MKHTNQEQESKSAEERKCSFDNIELVKKVREWVRNLAMSGGKDWTLEVPVNFNKDPDVLIEELCKRFESSQAYTEHLERMESYRSQPSPAQEQSAGEILYPLELQTLVFDYVAWLENMIAHVNKSLRPQIIQKIKELGEYKFAQPEQEQSKSAEQLRTEFENNPPYEFAAENYWEVYAGWLEGKVVLSEQGLDWPTIQEIIHKGIEFSNTLNADNESYLSGAGFGYSCGYQAAMQSIPALPVPDAAKDAVVFCPNCGCNKYRTDATLPNECVNCGNKFYTK